MFDKVFKTELEKPGPGYYQAPSEFGQYDGEIYQELRQGKRSKNGWDNLSDRKIPKWLILLIYQAFLLIDCTLRSIIILGLTVSPPTNELIESDC